MNTTIATWPGRVTVQAAIARPTAMRLAETEYQRIADAVDALAPDGWIQASDCTAWDIRQLVSHIAGMAKFASTPWRWHARCGRPRPDNKKASHS